MWEEIVDFKWWKKWMKFKLRIKKRYNIDLKSVVNVFRMIGIMESLFL